MVRAPAGAHDAARADCPLTGETADPRLLKSAIAAAVREAGWHATLEATGPQGRWRADVLATSPDGGRRVAWEAQLARQHDDDTLARTKRYTGDGLEVVWVFDRPVASAVPAVIVEVEHSSIRVAAPLLRLHVDRCQPGACSRHRDLPAAPPCPGHERWEPATLDLDASVGLVCRDTAVWVRLPAAENKHDARTGRSAGWWWTSPVYLRRAEAVHDDQRATDTQVTGERAAMRQAKQQAEHQRSQRERRRLADAERHAERLAALVERQERLTPMVIRQVTAQVGTAPWRRGQRIVLLVDDDPR